MGLFRVVNDNVHPFQQEYKGKMIKLSAKGNGKNFVDMEYDDAIAFMGAFSPIRLDFDGQPTPESYKMLSMVPLNDGAEQEKEERFICQSCRHEAGSQEELDAHIEANHMQDLADKEEAEKAFKRRGKRRGGSSDGEVQPI